MRGKVIVLLVTSALIAGGGLAVTAKSHSRPFLSRAPSFLAAPFDATQLSAWSVHPWAIPADGYTQTVITATIDSPPDEIERVSLDLTALGGSADAPLYDDGAHNDGTANDGTFGLVTTAAPTAHSAEIPLYLTLGTQQSQTVQHLGTFAVLAPPGAAWPVSLPAFLGWGSGDTQWQHGTGLPWNYQASFLGWNWQVWNPNFVRDFTQEAWDAGRVPVFTVEMLLAADSCDGLGDKLCAFAHLQDATVMEGYYSRLVAAADQAAGDQPVLFHIEPDVTAYMQHYSIDHNGENGIVIDEPDTIPAWSGPGYPDTYAGAVQRMVDIIHQHAPNALVGLHARSWANGPDVALDDNPDLDVDGIAQRTAHFVTAAGGAQLDLIFVDWKTYDAGSGLSPWWDAAQTTLPHFNRILYFENRLAVHGGRALVLWHVPVGNMALPNVCEQYQDNRVDYAFTHVRDLVDAGIVAVVLGGGGDCRTKPSTDGGNVEARATTYYAPPAAPASLTATVPGPPGLVQVAWSPNAEIDLWGYRLYYGRSADDLSFSLDARRQTRLHTVLPAGGQWFLSLVAYDARGVESQMSPAVSVTLDEPYHVYLPLVRR